ncbi:unnamed protein product [Prorocentrum cordatum]|uniref:Uncharacterized protein n=1 Tax=Prorocentrum cordatum TaxID=2364126 RepID=A0ABN9R417_9DINO|nr:unnamed protein product [Polarella glacialis]
MRSATWGIALLRITIYTGGILSCVALRDAGTYPGYAETDEDFEPLQEFNPHMYFGSVSGSMYTIFNLAMLTEFTEFARAIWMRQPVILFFFAVFACTCCFGMQSFLITACVERVSDEDKKQKTDMDTLVENSKLSTLTMLSDVFFDKDSTKENLRNRTSLELRGFLRSALARPES